MLKTKILWGVAALALTLSVSAAQAITTGVTVDALGSSNQVGNTENRPLLGGVAVEYFIPLTSAGTCTYGIDCGTSADSGFGGTLMSMYLEFNPVETTVDSLLSINFEDLDLIGANEPIDFLEIVQVFDDNGVSLTGLIDDISSLLVSGDADTQQLLTLNLGTLTATSYYLRLQFTASSNRFASNTPEYLVATIGAAPPNAGASSCSITIAAQWSWIVWICWLAPSQICRIALQRIFDWRPILGRFSFGFRTRGRALGISVTFQHCNFVIFNLFAQRIAIYSQ